MNILFKLLKARLAVIAFLIFLLLIFYSNKTYSFPRVVTKIYDVSGDASPIYIDIVSAKLEASEDALKLAIALRGEIPEKPDAEKIIYRWHFDVDNNSSTGIVLNNMGYDYTVEIVYDSSLSWHGQIISAATNENVLNIKEGWIQTNGSRMIVTLPRGFYYILCGKTRWVVEAVAYKSGVAGSDIAPNERYAVGYIPAPKTRTYEELENLGPSGFKIFIGFNNSNLIYSVGAGKINSISYSPLNPCILYITAGGSFGSGGVYKSTNCGKTWLNIWNESDTYANYVLVHPQYSERILVTTLFSGIYYSRDGGKTWRKTYDGKALFQIAYVPSDPNHVYVSGRDGILESLNFGESWHLVYRSDKPLYSISVVEEDGHVYVYAGGHSGSPDIVVLKDNELIRRVDVNKEIDSTVHWIASIAASSSEKGLVYATFWGEKTSLYISRNHGKTWRKVSEPVRLIYLDPKNESILIGDTDYSVSISRDGGKTWQQLFPYNVKNIDIRYISINPENPNTMYVCSDQGIWVTNDRGKTWQALNNISNALIYNFAVNPRFEDIILTSAQDYSPFITFDGGKSWLQLDGEGIIVSPSVGEGGTVAFNPSRPEIAYVYTTAGLQISEDYGYTFKHVSGIPPMTANSPNAIAFNSLNPKIVYLATSSGLYVSEDWGRTWTLLALKGKRVLAVLTIEEEPETIFAGCEDGFYYSKNGGLTFSKSRTKLRFVNSIAYDRETRKIFIAAIDGVYVSDNGGRTFIAVGGLPKWFIGGWGYGVYPFHATYAKVIIDRNTDPPLIIVATGGGLYYSKNNGISWSQIPIKLNSYQITDVKIMNNHPDTLYISTFGSGIYVLKNVSKLTGTRIKGNYRQIYKPNIKLSYRINGSTASLKCDVRNASQAEVFWGDGTSNWILPSMKHTYSLPGTYTICAVAGDVLECINVTIREAVSKEIEIKVSPPALSIRSGENGQVNFTFYNNYSNKVKINTYDWQFRHVDGTLSYSGTGILIINIQPNTHVTWKDEPYLIPQVVEEAVKKGYRKVYLDYIFHASTDGIKSDITITLTIFLNTSPSLDIFTPKINGLTVEVNGVTMPGHPNASIEKIYWNWGDGSADYSWFPARHTYKKPGNYTIIVTSIQSDGQKTTRKITVKVQRPYGEDANTLKVIAIALIILALIAILTYLKKRN